RRVWWSSSAGTKRADRAGTSDRPASSRKPPDRRGLGDRVGRARRERYRAGEDSRTALDARGKNARRGRMIVPRGGPWLGGLAANPIGSFWIPARTLARRRLRPSRRLLADFQIESHWTFVASSHLKLHRVFFVQILDLHARRETAAMKKHFLGAVVGNNKTETLLSDDFFYRPCHTCFS